MTQDPNAPLTDHAGGLWIQHAVGAAVLLVGLMLALLLAYGGLSLLTSDGPWQPWVLLPFLAVVGVLAVFFLSAGWRLTLNRPNRHGSLLTPALWFAIAALFLAGGLVMATLLVAHGRFIDLDAAASALVLAVLAALAGRRAMSRTRRERNSR